MIDTYKKKEKKRKKKKEKNLFFLFSRATWFYLTQSVDKIHKPKNKNNNATMNK